MLFLFPWQSLKRPDKAAEQKEIKAHLVGPLRRVKLSRLSFEQSPGEVSRLLNSSLNLLNATAQWLLYISCRNSEKCLMEKHFIWYLGCLYSILKFNMCSFYKIKLKVKVICWCFITSMAQKAGFSKFIFSLSIKTTVVHHRCRINILDLYQVIKQQVS